jgi:hypothetical protein
MNTPAVRATTIGDLDVMRTDSSAGTEYVVDLPFDVDVFDSAPTPGPYGTFAEAASAAHQLWDLISNACD